jgi:hypothetical protein
VEGRIAVKVMHGGDHEVHEGSRRPGEGMRVERRLRMVFGTADSLSGEGSGGSARLLGNIWPRACSGVRRQVRPCPGAATPRTMIKRFLLVLYPRLARKGGLLVPGPWRWCLPKARGRKLRPCAWRRGTLTCVPVRE